MIIKRHIDLKHHIEVNIPEGRNGEIVPPVTVEIVKSGNGTPIPNNEPIILFRGRDRLAVPMLKAYMELCKADGCNDFQLEQIDVLISKFHDFTIDHPETMKQPGSTRGK